VLPIPKSSDKERLQENIDIFDFELRPEDASVMDSLNINTRIVTFTPQVHSIKILYCIIHYFRNANDI